MKSTFKTRIAPTPSGLLHAGNGASFLLTYALAKAFEGKILLRIDDLDADRMRLEYVEDIFKTLDWLGIEWDEGPTSVADFQQNWSQHHRLDLYQNALEKLRNTVGSDNPDSFGKGVLYACSCSRKQIKEASQNGLYPQTCRFKNINLDEKKVAWRMHIPDGTTVFFNNFDVNERKTKAYPSVISRETGDFVVRQKNGLPAYQIASVVDDGHFGVNFIVRGADLLPSTGVQIFIAEHLKGTDFKETLFLHHNLLTDSEGGKLSKSKGATALAEWQSSRKIPESLIKQAANWLDLPNIGNINELIAACKSLNIPLSIFVEKD